MPFLAKIVLDSITPYDIRLTTFELTYPLIIHNELLTHRTLGRSDDAKFEQWLEFSRNSSSNRALSPAKIRQAVLEDPYIPNFVVATKGMVGAGSVDTETQRLGQYGWLKARDEAVRWFDYYETMPQKVHKQHKNRLLGPFQWITTVVTGNEEMWEHFVALRDHPDAQPDIQIIAAKANELFKVSTPQILEIGQWHLPYILPVEYDQNNDNVIDPGLVKDISVARCARSSYLRQGEVLSVKEDIELFNKLKSSSPPHGSPFEHVAMSTSSEVRSGNFYGWLQYRKELRI